MKRAAFALVLVLAGCAGSPRTVPWTGPTYTRAAIADLPTDALARMMLPPARAADVVRHHVRRSLYHNGMDLQGIDFYQRPYPLAPDICVRPRLFVSFANTLPYRRRGIGLDLPKRIERIDEVPEIALAPGCAEIPGRRFAEPRGDLSLVEGVRILRTLGTVRELAAGTQPLSFRLLCVPRRGEAALCTADERAALAAMPLHTAYAIERTPRPFSCQPDDHLGGDLVLFDREGPGFWQVRMIAMGQPEATVVFSAAGRRVACL